MFHDQSKLPHRLFYLPVTCSICKLTLTCFLWNMADASGGKATLLFLESTTGGVLGVKCLVFVSQHTQDHGQTFMIETVLCSGSRVGEYIICMYECLLF